MKKLIIYLCLFNCVILYAQSNILNASNASEIGIKNFDQKQSDAESSFLVYDYIDDRDILWSKIVYEKIDLNEKLNFPLLFPIDDKVFRNRKSLWKVLNENIKNRKITELYRANNDQFLPEKKLNQASVDSIVSSRINIGGEITINEITSDDIKSYFIKGIWYFDKRQGEMKYRLLGIMPSGNVKNKEGEIQETDLFWIWYPSIRKILHGELVFNDRNNANRISFDSQETASPVADDSSISINEGDTSSGTLSGSDSDSSDSDLTFAVVGNPTSGSVTIESNGSFTYVHSGGEGTSDSFTFSISDETNNTSNIATVTITINSVNDQPVVADVTKTLDEGASAEINVSGTDAEGAILVYEVVTQPQYGTYTFDTSSGIGYYTHDGSETTSDSIIVRAKESTENVYSANATISITITAVNDAPLSPDSAVSVDEGNSTNSTSFGASDSEGSNLTINVSSQGSNGTAVVSGTEFVYTHDGSETTTDTFYVQHK